MKPTWLIETGLWKDTNVPRMIAILRDLGMPVHAEQYTYLGGTEFEAVGEDGPVIYYGSLNTADYLRVRARTGCRSSGSMPTSSRAVRISPTGGSSSYRSDTVFIRWPRWRG